MPLLVPRVALASSIHPPAHPLRALQHHPSYSRARCPCVAIYIKRWSVASRSAETRASVAEGRPTEKEKALGKGGRVEREGGDVCASLPLALSLAFSRDRQRRRSSENTRIRNATAAQYAPTFCATKKRFPRSLPFDREPLASRGASLAFVHAFTSHFSRLFAEFSNFPSFLSLSFSLSLSLVRVPAFLFPFDSYFLSLSLLSLSRIFLRIRSRGMNGNGRHVRTHVYGHVLCSIYSC